MAGSSSETEMHLCVLIHGLWGKPSHLQYVASQLRERHGSDRLAILMPRTNAGTHTYDGIELCAERVVREVEDELARLEQQAQPARRLSIVGYSLGGLIARYVVGILLHNGWLDRLEPVNFTTFASPHLGVRSPVKGVGRDLFNALGARTLSESGRQLFLTDRFRDTGRPLLLVLAEREGVFARALARFRRRSLYANIVNDRSAAFFTTYISRTDPYVDLARVDLHPLPGYPAAVLLDPDRPVTLKQEQRPAAAAPASTMPLVLAGRQALRKLSFYAFLVLWAPLGTVIYLAVAGVQSVRSQQRIQLHRAGKLAVPVAIYNIPLLHALADSDSPGSDETGSDEPGSGEHEHEHDHLNKDDIFRHDGPDGPDEKGGPPSASTLSQPQPQAEADFPSLALTAEQLAMVDSLDALGWHKFAVHIHEAMHSHAAIIRRMDRSSFAEGATVVRHWVDGYIL